MNQPPAGPQQQGQAPQQQAQIGPAAVNVVLGPNPVPQGPMPAPPNHPAPPPPPGDRVITVGAPKTPKNQRPLPKHKYDPDICMTNLTQSEVSTSPKIPCNSTCSNSMQLN